VHCLQSQNIFAAQARNRAFQDCRATCPLTEFASDLLVQACIYRLAHEAQSLLHTRLGDEPEKWRLLKLDG
jgi:hypothetical protein